MSEPVNITPDMHTCPRRVEDGTHTTDSPFRNSGPDQDAYTPGHGIGGQHRGCTYCGSMHPDDFLEAIRAGATIGPTDKNYKAYVEGWEKNAANGGKFYFQHLSTEQRHEFVRLLNEGSVTIGYPGFFHVRPFFVGTR